MEKEYDDEDDYKCIGNVIHFSIMSEIKHLDLTELIGSQMTQGKSKYKLVFKGFSSFLYGSLDDGLTFSSEDKNKPLFLLVETSKKKTQWQVERELDTVGGLAKVDTNELSHIVAMLTPRINGFYPTGQFQYGQGVYEIEWAADVTVNRSSPIFQFYFAQPETLTLTSDIKNTIGAPLSFIQPIIKGNSLASPVYHNYQCTCIFELYQKNES